MNMNFKHIKLVAAVLQEVYPIGGFKIDKITNLVITGKSFEAKRAFPSGRHSSLNYCYSIVSL